MCVIVRHDWSLMSYVDLTSYNWAIPFNKGTPHMDDRAICLPWDKNFALTPLGQTVVYRELWEIY